MVIYSLFINILNHKRSCDQIIPKWILKDLQHSINNNDGSNNNNSNNNKPLLLVRWFVAYIQIQKTS